MHLVSVHSFPYIMVYFMEIPPIICKGCYIEGRKKMSFGIRQLKGTRIEESGKQSASLVENQIQNKFRSENPSLKITCIAIYEISEAQGQITTKLSSLSNILYF